MERAAGEEEALAMASDSGAVVLGEKVVLTFPDVVGAGIAAFCTEPPLTCKLVHVSPVQLSLEPYGLSDQKVSLHVSTFSNKEGISKVSVIEVSEKAKPHLCGCIAHAICNFIMTKAPTHLSSFSLIIPSATILPNTDIGDLNWRILFYAFNGSLQGKKEDFSKLKELPSTTQLQDEFLASILQFVNILEIRAVVLLVAVRKFSSLDSKEAQNERTRMKEADLAAISRWKQTDGKALATIALSLENTRIYHISNANSSKEAWGILTRLYEVKDMVLYLRPIVERELGVAFSANLLNVTVRRFHAQEMLNMGADWHNLYI